MNRSFRPAAVAALALVLAAAPALAAKEKKAEGAAAKSTAVVNGKPIPLGRLEAVIAAQIAQAAQQGHEIPADKRDELRNAVRDRLVTFEILEQAARAKGLDKKPEISTQMDMARQSVLINSYINEYVRANPITEEALKKEYEAMRTALSSLKEYKARHILLESEAEATAIIEKIKKGEKFEELAKQSKDPGSKSRGGELDWLTPNRYVKPFSEAMVKLEKGKFTETPVKTDFGYHVIRLDDVRPVPVPEFDQEKPQLAQRLQQQLIDRHLADLRGKAKVE